MDVPVGVPDAVGVGAPVCVRLSVDTCDGVIVIVSKLETVCVGEPLAVEDAEGVKVSDADPVSLRLWVSLGVREVDEVTDALPVGPWLAVCVALRVAAWLGDWVELRLEVCDCD